MKKRTHAFCLRLTEEEFKNLTRKAADAGISREEFCRRILNGAEVRACPPPVYSEFIRELRRIGSNIDQILRIAYTKAPMQIPELKKALSSLLEIEDKIENLYFGDDI